MGERTKGEGGLDAEGGRMVATGKSLWTMDQKLHINAANSEISISVYSADNNTGWTMAGQTVHKQRAC